MSDPGSLDSGPAQACAKLVTALVSELEAVPDDLLRAALAAAALKTIAMTVGWSSRLQIRVMPETDE